MRVVVQADSAVAPEATRTPAAKLRLAVWEACRRRRLRLAARAVRAEFWRGRTTVVPAVTPTLAAELIQAVLAILLPRQLRLAVQVDRVAGETVTEPAARQLRRVWRPQRLARALRYRPQTQLAARAVVETVTAPVVMPMRVARQSLAVRETRHLPQAPLAAMATAYLPPAATPTPAAQPHPTARATRRRPRPQLAVWAATPLVDLNRVATRARAAVPHLTVRATVLVRERNSRRGWLRLWGI